MKYFLILLFACTTVFAQKKFTIIDGTTKAPVPYASVDFNNGFGTYAGAEGEISISDTLVKQVTVSSIGYRAKKSTLADIGTTLAIQPDPIELQEVIVTKKKARRRENTIAAKKHQDNMALFMSSVGLQYAFLVNADKNDAYLSKITLPLIKIAFEAEGRPGVFYKIPFHTLIKLEILENNNGLPGEKLYDFEQLATVSNMANDTQFVIGLSEEIPVAENGMFVQLTILGKANANGSVINGSAYTTYKDADGKIQRWATQCQPNFPLVKRPKGVLTFIREPFSKNKAWRTIDKPHLQMPEDYPDFNIGFGYTTVTYE